MSYILSITRYLINLAITAHLFGLKATVATAAGGVRKASNYTDQANVLKYVAMDNAKQAKAFEAQARVNLKAVTAAAQEEAAAYRRGFSVA